MLAEILHKTGDVGYTSCKKLLVKNADKRDNIDDDKGVAKLYAYKCLVFYGPAHQIVYLHWYKMT